MVESTALEMRRARKGTVGSNPTFSASQSTYCKQWIFWDWTFPAKCHFLAHLQTFGERFWRANPLRILPFL